MNRRLFFGAAGAAFAALAAPARAHAMLVGAEPPVGAHVGGPVCALRLTFSERLELTLCALAVFSGDGAQLQHGAPALESAGKTLVVAITPPLAAGRFIVRWRAVSVDTHVTEGDFSFAVGP